MKPISKTQIADAVLELHKELQDELWLLNVQSSSDDAGLHIEIIVNGYNYPREDPLSRRWKDIPLVVIKKNIRINGEKLV